MTDFHKEANDHLPQDFLDLYDSVRSLVGQPNTELIIQESDEHGAATDMESVFMGSNYVAWTIPENYHGFPDKYVAAGVAFTIGHELGHITVHPGQGSDWMKEVRNLPVDAHEQFMWSNIISDIMVNYMVSRGSNFLSQSSQKAKDMIDKLDFGHRGDTMFRVASSGDLYGDPSKHLAIDAAALLLQKGVNAYGEKMVDNRYTPPPSTGLKQGDFYPHEKGNPQSISTIPPETPLYQTLMGYGRGPQIYPPIQHCVSHKHPDGSTYPKHWKYVALLKKEVKVHKTAAGKYQVYQDKAGQCPITGTATKHTATFKQKSLMGKLIEYEVLETMTYDGRSNPTTIEPVEFYKIKGSRGTPNWIPARYCCPIDPDTSLPCSPNWNVHFGYKPPDYYKTKPGFQKYSFSCRLMLTLEWAVYYATRPEGYGKTSGRDAATKFMKDIGYTLHAAAMEGGGSF